MHMLVLEKLGTGCQKMRISLARMESHYYFAKQTFQVSYIFRSLISSVSYFLISRFLYVTMCLFSRTQIGKTHYVQLGFNSTALTPAWMILFWRSLNYACFGRLVCFKNYLWIYIFLQLSWLFSVSQYKLLIFTAVQPNPFFLWRFHISSLLLFPL